MEKFTLVVDGFALAAVMAVFICVKPTPLASGGRMAVGYPIRIIPHRGVDDDCGSLEVWFADGRASVRFYWDNLVFTPDAS
jgi:hypothetical protein